MNTFYLGKLEAAVWVQKPDGRMFDTAMKKLMIKSEEFVSKTQFDCLKWRIV